MKLITAHKILISSAIVFFVFFALWELRHHGGTEDGWGVGRAALYILVAIGFAIYFKNLKRWYK
jgi:hypothetical protein